MKSAPKLSLLYKVMQLQYCGNCNIMEMGEKWKKVIFSDKKNIKF